MLSEQEQSIYVFAARYAHSRNTGAANQVVSDILAKWGSFSATTKGQLKREACNEATCNKEDWERLLNKPNNEQQQR